MKDLRDLNDLTTMYLRRHLAHADRTHGGARHLEGDAGRGAEHLGEG